VAKFAIYGKVVGTKYIGEVEAANAEEAEAKGWKMAHVSVCHQCSDQIGDPEIDEIVVEPQEVDAE